DELDLLGQEPIDAVADDRVRLPAADLHDDPGPRDRRPDALEQARGDIRIAILVQVSHGSCPSSSANSAVCPISSSTSHARAASSRSTVAMAKPTWTRTKSPGCALGSYSKQTSRLIPPKRTFPKRIPCFSKRSTTSPGIARHMWPPRVRLVLGARRGATTPRHAHSGADVARRGTAHSSAGHARARLDGERRGGGRGRGEGGAGDARAAGGREPSRGRPRRASLLLRRLHAR